MKSRLPGFYRLPLPERQNILADTVQLTAGERDELVSDIPLESAQADLMIENAIGIFSLPYGIAVNFLVNSRDYLVPMVTEEPSIVAAASHAARITRDCGGIEAAADPSLMTGQIHVIDVPDAEAAAARVKQAAPRLIETARSLQPRMVARGCGAREIGSTVLPDGSLLVHLVSDVGDAMGANAVNTLVEKIAPHVVTVTGGIANIRIVSNLSDRRLARARATIPEALLGTRERTGGEMAHRIDQACALATNSPHRAATHNKGIMNGIDSLALATGQDWRALEAGAHAFAARDGSYQPLATWRHTDGHLHGRIEIPLAVGTVGARITGNPRACLSLRLLGIAGARELAAVMAAVGLAQNLAALRALVGEGIQRGHMALHQRNQSA
ncbi:hydroxymethylglutaryl-CoA reductase, degradative [Kitasatospora brasiliensis]|uniref:hydroxymethylglutaryl-CoA reductase, degradative n=1 Tax=Kitasatospora brasiliensis TaxID=3058040 RepID=UPI0029314E09|nr:hydroxymethylglutaryl-CoA reductase, degradative [Kitasatospora sp. K002]